MHLVFHDDPAVSRQLLPFTFTRPISTLRTGICTIEEEWNHLLVPESFSHHTAAHLQRKYPFLPANDSLFIQSHVLPDEHLILAIRELPPGMLLTHNGLWLAARSQGKITPEELLHYPTREYPGPVNTILHSWNLFTQCGENIVRQFGNITGGHASAALPGSNRLIGPGEWLFIDPSAIVEGAMINTTGGPVYIGPHAEVMEGSMIRGPFSLGEHSQLKMGAKIYGPTAIGPHCKVGGEVNNSIFNGYSNKAHDGFLGNAVIGEWCNIGADSNNSNLKNNYAEVKLWDYAKNGFTPTGLQFCGLMMGDHSKCGINTMFNTGTVVGVSANIFGDGFPRNYIPSFSWGGAAGFKEYRLQDAIDTAVKVFARRNREFDETERDIFRYIHEQTPEWHTAR